MAVALGMDIGGTNIKIGLITAQGEVVAFEKFSTFPENRNFTNTTFTDVMNRLAEKTSEFLKFYNETWSQVVGIGVGAPDVSGLTGVITHAPNLGWREVNLLQGLKEAFSRLGLKPLIQVENDANVAAMGEGLFGKARGLQNFIVLTLGTGLGSGVVVEGNLVRSTHGLAGELGHVEVGNIPQSLVLPQPRQCHCGGENHLECFVSVRGLKLSWPQEISFGEFLKSYQEDCQTGTPSSKTIEVAHATAQLLGRSMAQVGSLLSPEKIILAGGVSLLGERFLQVAMETYEQYLFHPLRHFTKWELSSIAGDEGAILGAASLVLRA